MPLLYSPLLLFKVWIQPQRPEYSECIAEYIHSCNETFCLLRIAVRSHMWRWQHGWVYSHLSSTFLPFFLSFFPIFFFFLPFLSSPLPAPILSMSSTDSLPLVADPQRQSALFCLSAIVYQHKNTNGQQLKAINSFEVDPLCAWHQPPWLLSPNASRSIAATTSPPHHKTLASYLKPLVFKALPASSTAVWNLSPTETWIVALELFWCSCFVNRVVRSGIICTVLKKITWQS